MAIYDKALEYIADSFRPDIRSAFYGKKRYLHSYFDFSYNELQKARPLYAAAHAIRRHLQNSMKARDELSAEQTSGRERCLLPHHDGKI